VSVTLTSEPRFCSSCHQGTHASPYFSHPYITPLAGSLRIHPLQGPITLCNTIFVPGFQLLYFNCLCLKPMEKRLHSAQTLILRPQHKKIRIYCGKTRKFLYCRSCGLIKNSTCMVNRQRQSIITHNGSEMIMFSRFFF